ncbi:MAG: sulfurtransferase TusA family protein [Pseudomonadota bacterium]
MAHRIDARGLSCPQPVVLARAYMEDTGTGEFEVIVDTGAARDNITRLASGSGWMVVVREQDNDFILSLKK